MSFPWKYRTVSAGMEISGCQTKVAEPDEDGNGEVSCVWLLAAPWSSVQCAICACPGCLQLPDILEISWNLKSIMENGKFPGIQENLSRNLVCPRRYLFLRPVGLITWQTGSRNALNRVPAHLKNLEYSWKFVNPENSWNTPGILC